MSTAIALTDEQRTEIHDSRSQYSAEDRVCAVMAYIVAGGNSNAAARAATKAIEKEISPEVIRQWKSRAPWWPKAVTIARTALQQDLSMKYTRFLMETEKEMLDRVKTGDTHLHNGELVKIPVKLRDLVVSHGVISDKYAMLHGQPTSRTETTGVDLIFRLAAALQEQGEKKIAESIPGKCEVEDGKFN